MRKTLFAVAAATVMISSAAIAAVTFDSETGTGFVGKGDVQLAFGWNNATAQTQAKNVKFSYESSESYNVTIEFMTGNPEQPKSVNTHTITQGKSTSIAASIAADPRKTGQYTGWNLNGLGTTTVTGDTIPREGESCPNGNLGCVVLEVEPVSSSGGLYVSNPATKNSPVLIYTN